MLQGWSLGGRTEIWYCLVVPEVVSPESGPQMSAPVISRPLKDLLVSQGRPAQLQCTVSGEGIAAIIYFFWTSYSLKNIIMASIWICGYITHYTKAVSHYSMLILPYENVESSVCSVWSQWVKVNPVLTDLQVVWYCNGKEIKDSDTYRMSRFGETCQLNVSRVQSAQQGEYMCTAINSAGRVSCSAMLSLDGTFELTTQRTTLADNRFIAVGAQTLHALYLSNSEFPCDRGYTNLHIVCDRGLI